VFPVQWTFSHLYEKTIRACLSNLVPQLQTRCAFDAALERSLTADFNDLKRGAYRTAVDLHRDRLNSLRSYLTDIHSHKTCLSCLARPPEKVLACGHAICDTCIRVFASKCSESRHSFSMEHCLMCRDTLDMKPFRLLPPTAGVRLLSLDGGGIKGIVPLIFLQDLETALARFKVPLRDHFDFVCGTSAGRYFVLKILRNGMELTQAQRWVSCDWHIHYAMVGSNLLRPFRTPCEADIRPQEDNGVALWPFAPISHLLYERPSVQLSGDRRRFSRRHWE